MNENFKILSNGVKMPAIGFGTYKSGSDEETAKIIKYALEVGYKLILLLFMEMKLVSEME